MRKLLGAGAPRVRKTAQHRSFCFSASWSSAGIGTRAQSNSKWLPFRIPPNAIAPESPMEGPMEFSYLHHGLLWRRCGQKSLAGWQRRLRTICCGIAALQGLSGHSGHPTPAL